MTLKKQPNISQALTREIMSSLRFRVAHSHSIQSVALHFPHCEFHHAVIQTGESQDLQILSRVLAQDPGRGGPFLQKSIREHRPLL